MKDNYETRNKRIDDAIALKEPDRVPMFTPGTITFPYFDAGLSMADVVYDLEKAKEATRTYLRKYQPDTGHVCVSGLEGLGPIMEKEKNMTMCWAGMPNALIDKNSLQQFIEFPTLIDDEFDELIHDRTKWACTKYLPRTMGLFKPMEHFNNLPNLLSYRELAAVLSKLDVQKMISDLVELNTLWEEHENQISNFFNEVESMGFPIMYRMIMGLPFDVYSDFMRGTMLGSTDLYDYPDEVLDIITNETEAIISRIEHSLPQPGKYVFIPMHKGMDGFLSDDHYEKLYFIPMLKIIDAINRIGLIPYLYTEGRYSSRIKFLKELPKGKTIIHFENMDMTIAKKELGNVACLTGAYPSTLLETGTKKQVIDEVKRLLDILAPGGGYIFDLDGAMHQCKRENVEALFDTIKTYGKY